MANEKDKLGDINVEMGDGNSVGHIGHKITYQAPPPPPNALYQNKMLAGEFDGQPSLRADGRYVFEKLFVAPNFDTRAEFEIQGVRLQIEGSSSEASVTLAGRPPIRTLWGAVCRILK